MQQTSENALLNWDVFVTPGIPIVTRDLPPGVREAHFQAMASTLIYGMRDGVLVDAFMTVKQANALADWVAAKGKNLTSAFSSLGVSYMLRGETGADFKRCSPREAASRQGLVSFRSPRDVGLSSGLSETFGRNSSRSIDRRALYPADAGLK